MPDTCLAYSGPSTNARPLDGQSGLSNGHGEMFRHAMECGIGSGVIMHGSNPGQVTYIFVALDLSVKREYRQWSRVSMKDNGAHLADTNTESGCLSVS